jgi:MraZ protein
MRHFLGTYYHTLDAKGRVSIPAKFRKDVGDELVVSRGLDGCIYLYRVDEWERQVEKLMALEQAEGDARAYLRAIGPHAERITVDSHGRIMIPPTPRELAGIQTEVLVLGVFNHIELWDPKRFEEYQKSRKHSFEEVAERLYKTPFRDPKGETKG